MDTVATVTVMRDQGPVVINLSDYDPATDTLADGSTLPPGYVAPDGGGTPGADDGVGTPGADDGAGTPAPKFVTQIGNRWFITDADGEPLDDTHTGFTTEAEANAAAAPADNSGN